MPRTEKFDDQWQEVPDVDVYANSYRSGWELFLRHVADGTPFPEDQPDRVRQFNRIMARVAAAQPGAVTLVDLNRLICPAGIFQSVVDGLTVRWPDGIHISPAGGKWIQPQVLVTVARLGLDDRTRKAVR